VAIVTGAGSGIGRAAALDLSREGFSCVLAGRRADALLETARSCAAPSLPVPADVGTHDGCRRVVAACLERWGRIDALVNNAGLGRVVPLAQTTPELLDETYRVNTMSAAWLTLLAWPVFERQGSGRIVNVSSIASIDPFPGFFAYAGSKAAMNLLAASAAKEGGAIGVRAFAVAPGAVETPMLRAAFDEASLPRDQTLDPEAVARVIADCAAGRRDADSGRVIPVLPEAARQWFRDHLRAHPPLEG
jgi:NAD(P)-dependent dehydrogenase (short-subunit alcohol dehydrogenase family)